MCKSWLQLSYTTEAKLADLQHQCTSQEEGKEFQPRQMKCLSLSLLIFIFAFFFHLTKYGIGTP